MSGPITALAAASPRCKITLFGRRTSGPCGVCKEGPQGGSGSLNPHALRWRGTLFSPLVSAYIVAKCIEKSSKRKSQHEAKLVSVSQMSARTSPVVRWPWVRGDLTCPDALAAASASPGPSAKIWLRIGNRNAAVLPDPTHQTKITLGTFQMSKVSSIYNRGWLQTAPKGGTEVPLWPQGGAL